MRWYLAGPIGHVKDDSDRAWRDRAKKVLGYIDPFEEEEIGGFAEKESPKDRFNRLRSAGEIEQVRLEMQDILRLDEQNVEKADGVLAYSPSPSWGTIREVALAYKLGKPVVIWTEAVGWKLANTLIGMSTVIVSTFEKAVEACLGIEAGE